MNSKFFLRAKKYIGVVLIAASVPVLLTWYHLDVPQYRALIEAQTVDAYRLAYEKQDALLSLFTTGLLLFATGIIVVLAQSLTAFWWRVRSSKP